MSFCHQQSLTELGVCFEITHNRVCNIFTDVNVCLEKIKDGEVCITVMHTPNSKLLFIFLGGSLLYAILLECVHFKTLASGVMIESPFVYCEQMEEQ